MNILITGATGFIGRHLVHRLIQEGHSVKALIRRGRDGTWLEAMGVKLCWGDICDGAAIRKAMQGTHQVFHLAAKVDAPGVTKKSLWAANVQGTEHIAEAALTTGIQRLVYCSSPSIYGRKLKKFSITEEAIACPDTPYAKSKLLSEQILQTYCQRHGLPVVIAQPSAVFGPGAASWAGLFQAIANRQFRLIGSGKGHHHITDVADTVEGLVQCGTTPGIEGRNYILAGPESISLYDFVSLITQELGVDNLPPALPGLPLEVYKRLNQLTYTLTSRRLPKADRIDLFLGNRSYDFSRARKELGYEPQFSPQQTIERTVEWFRHHGYLSLY